MNTPTKSNPVINGTCSFVEPSAEYKKKTGVKTEDWNVGRQGQSHKSLKHYSLMADRAVSLDMARL